MHGGNFKIERGMYFQILRDKPIRLQFSDIPHDIYCNATCVVPDVIAANECTKNTAKFLLYQGKYCH